MKKFYYYERFAELVKILSQIVFINIETYCLFYAAHFVQVVNLGIQHSYCIAVFKYSFSFRAARHVKTFIKVNFT